MKDLVPDYLEACRERGILQVRIIHGKGIGALRETVHSVLKKLSYVEKFTLAGEDGGGWGATIVQLKKKRPRKKYLDHLHNEGSTYDTCMP